MRKLIIFILSIFIFANCSKDKGKICKLRGKVINRDSKFIILKKETEDFRGGKTIEIPIDSLGNFQYDLTYDFVEAYELAFQDELQKGIGWRMIVFYPDNDIINFKLYSEELSYSNKISGGKEIMEMNAYNQLLEDKYAKKFDLLNEKIDSLEAINEGESDYAFQLSDSVQSLYKSFSNFELSYVRNNPTLHGYNIFLRLLVKQKSKNLFALDTLKLCAKLLEQKFPNHPYREISRLRLNGLTNIKSGGRYIDFTAKDSTNKEFTISDIIRKNKVTLIDFWSPWCGGCLYKSSKIIPIYKQFKNKGFEVIGIVGGITSKEQYIESVKKYKYPWLVLSEINKENNLWEKYSIHSAGAEFLIDNTGRILAVNPSVDEIKEHIQSEKK